MSQSSNTDKQLIDKIEGRCILAGTDFLRFNDTVIILGDGISKCKIIIAENGDTKESEQCDYAEVHKSRISKEDYIFSLTQIENRVERQKIEFVTYNIKTRCGVEYTSKSISTPPSTSESNVKVFDKHLNRIENDTKESVYNYLSNNEFIGAYNKKIESEDDKKDHLYSLVLHQNEKPDRRFMMEASHINNALHKFCNDSFINLISMFCIEKELPVIGKEDMESVIELINEETNTQDGSEEETSDFSFWINGKKIETIIVESRTLGIRLGPIDL